MRSEVVGARRAVPLVRSEGVGATLVVALGEEGFGWLAVFVSGGKPGFGPAAESLFFASPKKSNQKKGEPRPCPSGALRYSQRSGRLQTRFAQTMQAP